MKLLLLIGFIALYINTAAQKSQMGVSKNMKEPGVSNHADAQLMNKDSLIKKFKDYFVAKQESKIYYLPQDQMPCLVPTSTNVALIPNAWVNVQIPFNTIMPNPGLLQTPLVPPYKDATK